MDNSVIIKSSKNGITVVLDKDIDFETLKEKVKEKFQSSGKFFENADLALCIEGRVLTDEEETEIVETITEISNLRIVCIVDNDENKNRVFENAVKSALATEFPQEEKAPSCYFYKGTLRSGQVFESESSVVILGDVNPGGKVVAKGNVIVLGSLRGNIFAGANGDENAFVVALEMDPMQIKIGNVIARSADSATFKKNKSKNIQPKIAYVYDGNIYIEELTQSVLEDIRID
ncbi:MAG: septum site-determining protein MinC [Eubacteriales bacterium]|nr:septum site-determining protein MinC [Eubacteriales bacterium]